MTGENEMLNKVEVIEAGLRTSDGRGIMPGSTLYIKGSIPASWKRVARESAAVTERVLVVATPAPAADPTPTHDRDELIKDYTELFGLKPHHKMSTENIHKAIVEKLDAA
jgi:hypothetical protein